MKLARPLWLLAGLSASYWGLRAWGDAELVKVPAPAAEPAIVAEPAPAVPPARALLNPAKVLELGRFLDRQAPETRIQLVERFFPGFLGATVYANDPVKLAFMALRSDAFDEAEGKIGSGVFAHAAKVAEQVRHAFVRDTMPAAA